MRALGAALAATTLISALLSPAYAADHYLPGSRAPHWTPRLLLREQLPAGGERADPVLYVHGATFPSARRSCSASAAPRGPTRSMRQVSMCSGSTLPDMEDRNVIPG